MNAFLIDTADFCRRGEHCEGESAIADFVRLAEDLTDTDGVVRWTVQGGVNSSGYAQLTLSASASLQVMCRRCLSPFALQVDSESVLIVAEDEAAADEIDAMLNDESIDVIVDARNMNVLELIEDEVLLAIPLSPKHAICPDQLQIEQDKDSEGNIKNVSPFEVLGRKQ